MAELPRVAVLLSLLGDSPYLPALLASLASQRNVAWRLYWRYDGPPAPAGTAALDRFAATLPAGQVRPMAASGRRMGLAGSFTALLAAADPADGYAYCDQDDVWLPDKLARAMAGLAPDGPALYCSRQAVVDAALRPLALSPLPRRPLGLGNALVENVATGCATVLNPSARALLLAHPPPDGGLHDWWSYQLLAACGGALRYDPTPTILYRQHGGNAIGCEPRFLPRLRRLWRHGRADYFRRLRLHGAALSLVPGLGVTEARTVRVLLRLLDGEPLERLGAVGSPLLWRQRRLESLACRMAFLLPGGRDQAAVSQALPSAERA